MNPIQWKFRNLIVLIGLMFVFFFLFFSIQKASYENYSGIIIPQTRPEEVWEYMADFSHMKLLNPTIRDFIVTNESGHFENWKYAVEYNEVLSHWPYLSNNIVAKFHITWEPAYGLHSILSTHKTCFFNGYYCLKARSIFYFVRSDTLEGTHGRETINYQCPRILSYFCEREVVYQRDAIMYNLYKVFSERKQLSSS